MERKRRKVKKSFGCFDLFGLLLWVYIFGVIGSAENNAMQFSEAVMRIFLALAFFACIMLAKAVVKGSEHK